MLRIIRLSYIYIPVGIEQQLPFMKSPAKCTADTSQDRSKSAENGYKIHSFAMAGGTPHIYLPYWIET